VDTIENVIELITKRDRVREYDVGG